MDAMADNRVGTEYPARREVVVNFSAEALKAPFVLRCGAALVDYIVIIAIPVLSLLISKLSGGGGVGSAVMGSTGGLLTVLVGISNIVILPMMNGQSLGKMLTGLRIVRTDGRQASAAAILIRHLIGYPAIILTLGIGYLLAVLNRRGRAIDDIFAGTVLVYADRRIR